VEEGTCPAEFCVLKPSCAHLHSSFLLLSSSASLFISFSLHQLLSSSASLFISFSLHQLLTSPAPLFINTDVPQLLSSSTPFFIGMCSSSGLIINFNRPTTSHNRDHRIHLSSMTTLVSSSFMSNDSYHYRHHLVFASCLLLGYSTSVLGMSLTTIFHHASTVH